MKTLLEIAKLVDGKLIGDGDIMISNISTIQDAQQGDITFLTNPKYIKDLKYTKASAVVVGFGYEEVCNLPRVVVENPELASLKIAESFFCPQSLPPLIHPTVIIGKGFKVPKDVSIGAYTVIGEEVLIGEGTKIFPLVYIASKSSIGRNCLIYPGVIILERTIIGDNVIIHPGAVIGSDGFGYVTTEDIHKKIPHLGYVLIEDDCEIGANVTIDRARFGKTHIGKGTKIDNLVHIAHNVSIGEKCVFAAQVGIAGSAKLGGWVRVGGQAGIKEHLQIGKAVNIAAQAGVAKDLPDGSVVSGTLAREHAKTLREQAALEKLPELLLEFKKLKQKVKEIEETTKNS
jgi:UDP-3-O-[3-hydroxymyristoyl] glucosamine N-acyltransferase